MSRLWDRMRDVQSEYRSAQAEEVKRDLAVDFSRLAIDYMTAVTSSRHDPTKDIDGIAEIIDWNRYAIARAQRAAAREAAKAART